MKKKFYSPQVGVGEGRVKVGTGKEKRHSLPAPVLQQQAEGALFLEMWRHQPTVLVGHSLTGHLEDPCRHFGSWPCNDRSLGTKGVRGTHGDSQKMPV